MRCIGTEADFILSWMSKNFTFTVLESLTGFLVLFEWLRVRLKISTIFLWALVFFALLWEYPSEGRSSIEDDLHLLRWASEPEFALVSHVLKVVKINAHWSSESLLVFDLIHFLLEKTDPSRVALLLDKIDLIMILHEKAVINWGLFNLYQSIWLIFCLLQVNCHHLVVRNTGHWSFFNLEGFDRDNSKEEHNCE